MRYSRLYFALVLMNVMTGVAVLPTLPFNAVMHFLLAGLCFAGYLQALEKEHG